MCCGRAAFSVTGRTLARDRSQLDPITVELRVHVRHRTADVKAGWQICSHGWNLSVSGVALLRWSEMDLGGAAVSAAGEIFFS